MTADVDIGKKLDWIESELNSLKSLIMAKNSKDKKVVKLKGLCGGVVVGEEDFGEAKSSLFGG